MNHPHSQPPKLPSETLCAAVTAGLGLYLVGLVLSMLANTGSGGSPLVTTITSRLFSPWMVPAWLDLGFDYRLTHGVEEDADHEIAVRAFGDRSSDALLLPGDRSGERARRWRRLARNAVAVTDDLDRAALLPTAIGTGMMDEAGTDDVFVRVVRRLPPERNAPPAPPQQAFAGRVRLVDGLPQLIRQEPKGEVAPLVPRPAAEETP